MYVYAINSTTAYFKIFSFCRQFRKHKMLEITCNDRLGKKVRVKCNPDDTVGDLKKLIAAQTGTRWDKIILKKWYTVFKDHIQLQDCILFFIWFCFSHNLDHLIKI